MGTTSKLFAAYIVLNSKPKTKYIWNAIWSIISFIGFMVFIITMNMSGIIWLAGIAIFVIGAIGAFWFGIFTLVRSGDAQSKSLAVWSGILGLFGGAIGIGAIVSIIGATKE